jgi:folylpolyglutamate synthase
MTHACTCACVQVVAHPAFPAVDPSHPTSSQLCVYLDGAHTPESMVTCAAWFAQTASPPALPLQQQQQQGQQQGQEQQQQQQARPAPVRILLFNCMKERDPDVLLPVLRAELAARGVSPHVALFVPPDSQYAFLPSTRTQALAAEARADLGWQGQLQRAWDGAAVPGDGPSQGEVWAKRVLPPPPLAAVDPLQLESVDKGTGAAAAAAGAAGAATPPGAGAGAPSSGVVACVADALAWLKSAAEADATLQLQVLVTGSLYLVGDTLSALQQRPR